MAKTKKTSGRKPVTPAEKVILVGFYVKRKYVDILGGMDEVRTKAKEYIEGHAIGNEIGGIV